MRFKDLIEIEVVGMMYSQAKNGFNSMILQEKNGERRISIVIGNPEARAIECVLRHIEPPRPLTHDLMYGIMKISGVNMYGAVIDLLPGGVYRGCIMLGKEENEEEENRKLIDSRSSDAVALALRFDAPIYIERSLLDRIGVRANELPGENENPDSRKISEEIIFDEVFSSPDTSDLTRLNLEQLRDVQKKAIEEENYEEAARIKEEIDRRLADNDTIEND